MFPSYPSLTFPNHFTIVTGLYPEHTGIVANSFLDPAREARYSMSDAKAVTDGSWYSGVPFGASPKARECVPRAFSGSAPRPRSPASARLTTQPSTQNRAHAREPAGAHRRYGLRCSACPPPIVRTSSPSTSPSPTTRATNSVPMRRETRAAVLKMDAIVGKLRAALKSTGLPIDLVVVSDHGMVKSEGDWIDLDQFADLTGIRCCRLAPLWQDRRRSRPRLQPAQARLVAVCGLSAEECPRRSRTSIRIRARATLSSSPLAPMPFALTLPRPVSRHHPPTVGMHGFDPRKLIDCISTIWPSVRDDPSTILRAPNFLTDFDNCWVEVSRLSRHVLLSAGPHPST